MSTTYISYINIDIDDINSRQTSNIRSPATANASTKAGMLENLEKRGYAVLSRMSAAARKPFCCGNETYEYVF
jgi:hypothetical protein